MTEQQYGLRDIGIIGGGGHVGLPFGLVLADAGHRVTLIDTDTDRLETIADGEMPFFEPGAESLLRDALDDDRLAFTADVGVVDECDVVVFVIGTPIDEHHNPQMKDLLDLVDGVATHLTGEQLLLFRSTVYPGTTRIVTDRLQEHGFDVGEDVFVAFTPERTAQHNALEEIVELPQLIGAIDDESYRRARTLFDSCIEADCHRLGPTEAELGKLYTNMWRYITFAVANEFFLIAESFAKHYDVNIHRILEQTKKNYPRFDVPSPGANVGGPCLTKDGWFLVDNIPYNELVSASYQINEGIPSQLIDRMAQMAPDPEKVAILGMTFKANSDDLRNSVSFKLEKQLSRKGYSNTVCVEPNVNEFDDLADVADADWIILMTPHDEFDDLQTLLRRVDNPEALLCDMWANWEPTYQSDNGFFFAHEVEGDLNETTT